MAMESDTYQSTSNPSRASRTAGSITRERGRLPKRSSARHRAGAWPGALTDTGPSMFAPSFTAGQPYMPPRALPPTSSNMSARAARGARVPPSMATTVPSGRRITMPAMPPMPLVKGSTTPITNAAATAASTALPPSRSISTPASAARWCSAVTIPSRATGSVFQ